MGNDFHRRKIWWDDRNAARIDFGDRNNQDLFHFHWRLALVLEPTSQTVQLYCQDQEMGTYSDEASLKKYLVECAYGIRPGMLVPSEFLYDAGLAYMDPDIWIDSFSESDPGTLSYQVVAGIEDTIPPVARRIRLLNSLSHWQHKPRHAKHPPQKSKVKALQEEIDRLAEEYAAQYNWSSPRERKVYTYTKKIKPKTDFIPPRPLDGGNFSPIPVTWEDFSWEARCWRKPKDLEVQAPEEQYFFVLNAEEEDE